MIVSDGKCLIDAVELGDVELDLLRSTPIINARYAYTNSASGTRFGMGTKNHSWSEATMAKLAELQASMEADIVAGLFSEGATQDPTQVVDLNTSDGVPGL